MVVSIRVVQVRLAIVVDIRVRKVALDNETAQFDSLGITPPSTHRQFL
jgi:hypothetical protein